MRILSHTVIAAESGRTAKELLRGLWHISGSLLSRLKFRDGDEVGHQPAGQGFPLLGGEGVPGADLLPAELPAPVRVGHRGGVDGGFCHG